MASPTTLSDVARLAGVSLATASRVLNGSARTPSAELRDRVISAANRLNYTANAAAQAVARGRSNVVGLIVQDIADPYFAAIAAGVVRAAEAHGVITTLVDTRWTPEREIEYVSLLRKQRPLALLLAGSRTSDPKMQARLEQELAAFRSSGGRVALISQQISDIDTVLVENFEGAQSLAHELYDLGHRAFGVISGPANLQVAHDRLSGFTRGLADRGLQLPARNIIQAEGFTRDSGYEAAMRWIESGTHASCLFVVSDVMAVGAMAALRENGISVPGDISVAGFDGIATLRDIVPALSTVTIPLERMGEDAVELVMAPESAENVQVRAVAGTVLIRESTRRLLPE